MKKCPNCGELIGDNATKCFSCFFDLINPAANRVATERQRIAEENKIRAIRESNERI